jgi:hypothetical protein
MLKELGLNKSVKQNPTGGHSDSSTQCAANWILQFIRVWSLKAFRESAEESAWIHLIKTGHIASEYVCFG